MSKKDFEKKQLLFVFSIEGQKLSFRNDNVCITDQTGTIVHQSTCYRIFQLVIVGNCTITSTLIEKSHKFGFSIVLMTPNLRTIDIIGHRTRGNTHLRQLQYRYSDIGIAKHIVKNKIANQAAVIDLQRANRIDTKECRERLMLMQSQIDGYNGDIRGLMGIEGTASKLYFSNNFNNVKWSGRKPRIKTDIINSTLDIGYTLLFNYIDSMLNLYGFDTYYGVIHREFYMRKSLVCDLVEPFRPLIDWQVRKSINLGQIKEEHFNNVNGRFLLDIQYNKHYVKMLSKPLMDNKDRIFTYVQSYYRQFVKNQDPKSFPVFRIVSE